MNKKIYSLTGLIIFLLAGQIHAQILSPVLIELFTSQGCSSCPPAEELLNTWGMNLFKEKRALPLAFHVDYWDYLGWKDPFSSAFSTARQREYGRFFNSSSLFTPEMIIDGQSGFNGADLSLAENKLAEAPSYSTNLPSVKIRAQANLKKLQIQINFSMDKKNKVMGDSIINIVVFENDLLTKVKQGENTGVLLKENFVVHYYSAVNIGSRKTGTAIIPIDVSWRLSHCGVAVWIQDSQTMKYQGLNWVYPISISGQEKI